MVYDYVDHLKYLHDLVDYYRKETKVFSFRYFAKKAGFASQSSLKFYLEGKRKLTPQSIKKVCKGFKMEVLESRYFENLALLNQSKTTEQKNYHFQEMLKIQKRKRIRLITSDQYEYFSKWYHPAVRELIRCSDFQGEPRWIAKRLFPSISVREVKESIKLLERLGLIKKDSSGQYAQTERAVSTEREFLSMVGRNFHREMAGRAVETLDTVSLDRRDFSGITFGFPKSKVEELKQKLAEFRKELTSTLGSLEDEVDEVYHLNIQLFPLTKKEKK